MADPRVCVFCGEKTDKKTKEHVFPQWLLRRTGNSSNPVYLGYDFRSSAPKARIFPFSQVVLPACNFCNQIYSTLENRAGTVMDRIFAQLPISADDVETLMDWFDKVRVGVWLWELRFNKQRITPKFRVNKRLAHKDRSLQIIRLPNTCAGLGFVGTSTEAFLKSSSCFGLLINDVAFLNVSYDFLFSYRLGYPYVVNWTTKSSSELDRATLIAGTGKVLSPLYPGHFGLPGRVFAQCVYKEALIYNDAHQFYNSEHVILTKGERDGASTIFMQDGMDVISLRPDQVLPTDWYMELPTYNYQNGHEFAAEVLKVQRSLLNIAPRLIGGVLHPESQTRERTIYELNRTISLLREEQERDRVSRRLMFPT